MLVGSPHSPYYLKKPRERSLVVWKVLGREKGKNKILLEAASLGDVRENTRAEAVQSQTRLMSKSHEPLGSDMTVNLTGGSGFPPAFQRTDPNAASHSPAAIPSPTTLLLFIFCQKEMPIPWVYLPSTERVHSPEPDLQ